MSRTLEPGREERAAIIEQVVSVLQGYFDQAAEMPASGEELGSALAAHLMEPPPEEGRQLSEILADVEDAGRSGIFHPSGGHLSYIPNAGLFTGAVGEFLAAGLNRYTGVAGAAPGMTAIEHGMVKWMASMFGLGDRASGLLLSGGSIANFTAVVAARTNKLGDYFEKGVIYVTPHTHHSLEKAARLAGFRQARIRKVPTDGSLRMDVDALARAVTADRDLGLQPFFVVGSGGTTDTGAVDPLDAIGSVARNEGLWFHVDAAYGGFFQLTERGRARLNGIEMADSISVDPH
ncbi:MAG: aminotransferase class V-fold PLP-dependent enzyme, partial [Acidimicrobiia bacterium]